MRSSLVDSHRDVMLIVLAMVAAALVLRLIASRAFAVPADGGVVPGRATRIAYIVLIAASCVLMAYGGHLGGEMVYGERYLPF